MGFADQIKSILDEVATDRQTLMFSATIVFVKTKKNADKLSTRLYKDDLSSQVIHGDLAQQKRDREVDSFRKKRHKIYGRQLRDF